MLTARIQTTINSGDLMFNLVSAVVGFWTVVVLSVAISCKPIEAQDKVQATTQPAAPRGTVAIINRGACANCHIIPGVPGADGEVGPDLTTLGKVAGSRRPKTTAKEYIRESILDPDAFVAPGDFEEGVMPRKFGKTLSEDDLHKLVDYLASLGIEAPNAVDTAKPKLVRSRPAEAVTKSFAPLSTKAATDEQIALGKALFFERRLSASNALSCASCHQPDKAFTDGLPVSIGYPGTALFRNTPTLLNVSHVKAVYWDGRMSGADLASVVRDHLTEPFFMAADGRLLIERMKQVPEYVELFKIAYGVEPDFGTILKALAAYVGSLNSPPAAFDRFLNGDVKALSADALAGKKLFEGQAGCATCHPAPLFTDHKFRDLGLRTDSKLIDDSERHITFRRFFRGLGTPNYRNLMDDAGHFVVAFNETNRHEFRTPSLREVGRTSPYMHDGRFTTLEEIIDFYDRGGEKGQRAGLKPLKLNPIEKRQLVAFLKSLSSNPVQVVVPELPDYTLMPLGKDAPMPVPDRPAPVAARKPRPISPLPAPPQPKDNPTTQEKVELGRLLYFDTRLSADGATSCNTCHPAHTGYTARTAISMGGTGTSHWRNASTLYNVAYFEKFNWDGARGSIEDQNDGAWSGAVAGNVDADLAEERLAQVPDYRTKFEVVFGEDFPTWANALRAVAAYQRTLNSKGVPFDDFLKGDDTAISVAAKRGYRLFTGKANCIQCHDGALLSDDRYYNLGVPSSPNFLNSPNKQITFRFEQASNGVPRKLYESARDDFGLYYVTKRAGDIGKFRTASLRELEHTSPYMHNGVFKTLPEVIDFYDQGGGTSPNKSPLIKPLNLTKHEKADLLAFLESLSGDPLSDRPPPLPPYGPYQSKKGNGP
jgi:cytochrome c peroxidase